MTVTKLSRQADGGARVSPKGWATSANAAAAAAPANDPAPEPENKEAERPRATFGQRASTAAPAEVTQLRPAPDQRERMAAQLQGTAAEANTMAAEVDRSADAKSAFSAGLQARIAEVANGQSVETAEDATRPIDYAQVAAATQEKSETAKRTRKARVPEPAASAASDKSPPWDAPVTPEVRLGILQLAFSREVSTVDEGLEIAREMLEFVQAA